MARPGDAVVDPAGLGLVFRETAAPSGGAAIALDWFVPPGGRLVALPHVHPFDAETYPPDGPLLEGVERFIETLFALAQRGRVTSAGVILDPLQGAATPEWSARG
jgi:hypothetical protein